MTDTSGATPVVVPAGITQTVIDAALKAYADKLVADAKAQAKGINAALRKNPHTAMAISFGVGVVATEALNFVFKAFGL